MASNVDDLLDSLLQLILTDPRNEFALTVHSGGLLISGMAIHPHPYREALVKRLLDGVTFHSEKSASENTYDERPKSEQDDDDADFLHFRDVLIWGSGNVPIRIPYWRIRLDHVSGFELGKLSIE